MVCVCVSSSTAPSFLPSFLPTPMTNPQDRNILASDAMGYVSRMNLVDVPHREHRIFDYLSITPEQRQAHREKNPNLVKLLDPSFHDHLEGIEEVVSDNGEVRYHIVMNEADIYTTLELLDKASESVDFVSECWMDDPCRKNHLFRRIEFRDVRLLDRNKNYAKFGIDGHIVYSKTLEQFLQTEPGDDLVEGKEYEIDPSVFLPECANALPERVVVMPFGKFQSWGNRIVSVKIPSMNNIVTELPAEGFIRPEKA